MKRVVFFLIILMTGTIGLSLILSLNPPQSSATGRIAITESELLDLKRLQLRTNPIFLSHKEYNLGLEAGISERIALGPSLTLFKKSETDLWVRPTLLNETHGWMIGVHVSLYLSGLRFKGGWVLRPGLAYASLQSSAGTMQPIDSSDQSKGEIGELIQTLEGPIVPLSLGYQWVHELSGLSLELGALAEIYSWQNQFRARSASHEDPAKPFGSSHLGRLSPRLLLQLGYLW